jgi:hypothetical protein
MLHEVTQIPREVVTLSWTSPEDSLWVANVRGEYAGMVEFADGHFLVLDATGHQLGSHSNLRDAKALVADRAQAPTLLGTVHDTLHSLSGSIAATLQKPAPHYHRSPTAA